MGLKVYANPVSQPSRAVLIFLQITRIPHQYIFIDLFKNQQKSPEFLSINPMGLVPAITDDDFPLWESHAILTYLATTRQVPDHLYPKDSRKRARVDQYLHWHHGNLRRASIPILSEVIGPLFGLKVPGDVISDCVNVRIKAFEQLEKWLESSEYVAGREMSIADLAALCEVTMQGC